MVDVFPNAALGRIESRNKLLINTEIAAIRLAVLTAIGNNLLSTTVSSTALTATTASVTFLGNTATGSPNILAIADTSTLIVGQPISGTGIPVGATISTIINATSISISANATATNTGVTLTTSTTAQYYWQVWQATVTDVVKSDQMTQVLKYFDDLGYEIVQLTNEATVGGANVFPSFLWSIKW